MKGYNLPKKTIVLWQLRFTAVLIVVLALISFSVLITKWMLILISLLFLIFAAFVLLYLPRYLKSHKIKVSDDAFIINRGVFIKTTYILPFPRMIYAETITSPLAKAFKLSAVMIKAARGWIYLPEMENETAKTIMKIISGEKYE